MLSYSSIAMLFCLHFPPPLCCGISRSWRWIGMIYGQASHDVTQTWFLVYGCCVLENFREHCEPTQSLLSDTGISSSWLTHNFIYDSLRVVSAQKPVLLESFLLNNKVDLFGKTNIYIFFPHPCFPGDTSCKQLSTCTVEKRLLWKKKAREGREKMPGH